MPEDENMINKLEQWFYGEGAPLLPLLLTGWRAQRRGECLAVAHEKAIWGSTPGMLISCALPLYRGRRSEWAALCGGTGRPCVSW